MSALPAGSPGSTPWLLRHELRLFWRGIGGNKGRRKWFSWLFIGLLSLALHALAWLLLRILPVGGTLPAPVVFLLGGVAWLAFSLMLSQAILQSVTALFERGDLDLLLASPLPTHRVFLARGLGIAISVASLYLFLLAPVANAGLFSGHPRLLAIYPALAALALGATALGLMLTLLLVRLLGARRARTVAQLLGALVGALLFLATQFSHVVGPRTKGEWAARIAGWAAPGGPADAASPLWFPARAMLGEALPLLALLIVGGGAFWAVVRLAHRRFLAGTQESVTGSARRGPASRAQRGPRGPLKFRGGLARVVLLKEWRLILRDPQLIAQTLLQLLYMAPLLFIAVRGGRGNGLLLAPALVWLAASLAGSLAWITMAAEDAPELLGTAPHETRRLAWLKLLAAVSPVWLLLSPVPVALAWNGDPGQAAILLIGLLGGTVSLGFLQIAYPRQGKRSDIKHRGRKEVGIGLLELVVSSSWAATTWALLSRPLWAPAPLTLALLGVALAWWLGRSRRG